MSLGTDADAQMVGARVVVRRLTLGDAAAICRLLREDTVLHRAAGMSGTAPASAAEYLADIQRWEHAHSALCFALVNRASDQAIGMISLTRIDCTARCGRVGYWLASAHWGRGLTSEAFALVLERARALGLQVVRATIAADNIASQRIYLRHGATYRTEANGKRTYELVLSGS